MCHAVVPRVSSVRKKCFIQIVRHTIERTTSMRARAYMCGRALKNQTRTHVNMLIRSLINILTCHMYMVFFYKIHCHGVCHRQHVLKSRLVPSFSEMLPSFVPREHDTQPSSSESRKCLSVDLLSGQAQCSCPVRPSAINVMVMRANSVPAWDVGGLQWGGLCGL